MKFFMFIWLLLGPISSADADYKRLTDYQNILYQMTEDYVVTNSTSSSVAVLEFLYSDDTKTVFKDAQTAGYSRKDLLFGTYQSSFGVVNPRAVIINALHDAVIRENRAYDVAIYGSYTTIGASFITVGVLARFFWQYFRWDRPALNHYQNNHHLYTKVGSSTVSRIPLDTNDTNPLIPEPNFDRI